MGALGEDLGHFAIDSLDHTFFLFRSHILHLLLDAGLHLLSILGLLTDGDSEADVHQCLDVVLQVVLVEANDALALAWRDAQVNILVADGGILVVNDEEVTKSVEYNLVIVLRLDLPVALHTW